MDNPFGITETKAPTLKYKVLTPAFDPDLMKNWMLLMQKYKLREQQNHQKLSAMY